MKDNLPQFAVTALVYIARDDAVLLVRQNYGRRYWSLPGGSVEQGESVEGAAVREVKEETGLDVRLARLVGLYSKPAQDAVAILFEAEVLGGSIGEATDEIAECGYFRAGALPAPIRDHLVQRIADARQGLPHAVWRTQ
jgi:ADP-ribose pyrophosphatase YjhB (NUDIX family)